MSWKSRRDQEAVEGLLRMVVTGVLIISAVVAACSIQRMEDMTAAKIDQADARALYQRANTLAMQEVGQ